MCQSPYFSALIYIAFVREHHNILRFTPVWWLSCFQTAALKRHIVSHALLLSLQPGHAGSWRCLLTAPNKCCQKALPKCKMIFFWRKKKKKTWVIRTGFQKQQALNYFLFFEKCSTGKDKALKLLFEVQTIFFRRSNFKWWDQNSNL